MKDVCRHKVRKAKVLTSAYEFMDDKCSDVQPTPSLCWTHAISGKEFDGGCLVYKDKVFIKTNNTDIACLGHQSGEVLFTIENAFAKSNIWAEFIIFEDQLYAKKGKSGDKIQVYNPINGEQIDEVKANYYWDIVDDEEASDLLNERLDNIPEGYSNQYQVHGVKLPVHLAVLSKEDHSEVMLFNLDAQKALSSLPSSNPDYLDISPQAADDKYLVLASQNLSYTLSDPRRKEPKKSEGFLLSVFDTQSGSMLWKEDFSNFSLKNSSRPSTYGNLYSAQQYYYDRELEQVYVIVDSSSGKESEPEGEQEVDFKMIAVDVKTGALLWEVLQVTNFEAFTKDMVWATHRTYEQKYPYKTKKTQLVGVSLKEGKETFRKKVANSAKFHEITGGRLLIREGKKINCYA